MTSNVSGLAASIRNSTESETFDLAGQNPSTIEKAVRDAFSEPLPLSEMIRLTFVTGGGKLSRQKYHEDAAKAVTNTLRDLQFVEDRGASAVIECAGSYKLQHDTGKNLKTVVVFPRISAGREAGSRNDTAGDSGKSSTNSFFLKENSPEFKIVAASMNVFPRMIESQCSTWSQKKACVSLLESLKGTLQALEQQLMQGTPLKDAEQVTYDTLASAALEEKQTALRNMMQKQVDDGKITSEEKLQLLAQVKEKLDSLCKESAQNKKLEMAKQKAEERKKKLEGISPIAPPPLKHESEISKLRVELRDIEEVEKAAKGRLLTMKESQVVGKKDDVSSQISALEEASRGWFENDQAFEARLKVSRSKVPAKKTQKSTQAPKTAASSSAPSKWVTPGKGGGAWGRGSSQQQQRKPKSGGGLFAAMMEDSDSD